LYIWQSFDKTVMPKVIENKLIEAFKERSSFDRDELFQFY